MRTWGLALLVLAACEDAQLGPPPTGPMPNPPGAVDVNAPWYSSGRCASGEHLESVSEPDLTRPRVHLIGAGRAVSDVVTVDLDLDVPSTVVLSSTTRFTWRLSITPETTLTKLLLFGPAALEAPPSGVTLVQDDQGLCGWAYRDARCPIRPLLARIEAEQGAPISSLDGCYTLGAVALAGATAPVRFDRGSAAPELTFAEAGLEVRAPGALQSPARVWASHPHSAGRYYFEVEIEGGPGTRVGIGTRAGLFFCEVDVDGAAECGGSTVGGEPLAAGDRVGVAVDLERLVVYFARNGGWWSGDPERDAGLSIPAWVRREGVTPTVLLVGAGRAHAGFDPAGQRYQGPSGYGGWRRPPQ